MPTTLEQVATWISEVADQGGERDRADLLARIGQWERREPCEWAFLVGEKEDEAINALAETTWRRDVAEAMRAGVRRAGTR